MNFNENNGNDKLNNIFDKNFMKVGYIVPNPIKDCKNKIQNNTPFKFHSLNSKDIHNEVIEYLIELKNKYSKSKNIEEVIGYKLINNNPHQDQDKVMINKNSYQDICDLDSIRKFYYNEIDIKLLVILRILDLNYLIKYFYFKNIKFLDFLLLNEKNIIDFDLDIVSKNRILRFLNLFVFEKAISIKIKDIYYFFKSNNNLIFHQKSFDNLKNYIYVKNENNYNNDYYSRFII
jgi:hypothetical protein